MTVMTGVGRKANFNRNTFLPNDGGVSILFFLINKEQSTENIGRVIHTVALALLKKNEAPSQVFRSNSLRGLLQNGIKLFKLTTELEEVNYPINYN